MPDPPRIERLLVVRLGSMGDIIHTLPSVVALRQAFPQAMIGWIVEERWAELLCTLPTARSGTRSPQRPLVDRIHTVNTLKWRGALLSNHTWEQVASGLSELRAGRYQAAVDFQGAIRSALLASWSGAPLIYGARQPRENVASMFYSRQVMVRGTHVVEQNLSLAEAVAGMSLAMPSPEFPHDKAAEDESVHRLHDHDITRFVLINPGAGWGAKQWPAERYGYVAKRLAEEEGLRTLINFGPGEQDLMRAAEAASGGAAEGIACSLSQLIALTRRASLFIGGDTGPMHLAAGLNVPVVALFGPTDPARNGPFGTLNIVLRSPSSLTNHSRISEPDSGLLKVTSDDVVTAARQLLRRCHG
ncbi:MAG TPA: glycosyltransferase family 9 protein [Terriglobales bacterium]|nr:glycosyltransferase family 9 protein [Terriglobales bacterium]